MSRSLLLLVVGILVGVGAAVFGPVAIPRASAEAGKWGCYVVDRFPDVKDAADWRGAKNASEGLNQVAAGAPTGTVLSVQYPTASSGFATAQTDVGLICVKQ